MANRTPFQSIANRWRQLGTQKNVGNWVPFPIVRGRIGRLLLCNARDLALMRGEGEAWGKKAIGAAAGQCNASSIRMPPLPYPWMLRPKGPIRIWLANADCPRHRAHFTRLSLVVAAAGHPQSAQKGSQSMGHASREWAAKSRSRLRLGQDFGRRQPRAEKGASRDGQHSAGLGHPAEGRKGRISYGPQFPGNRRPLAANAGIAFGTAWGGAGQRSGGL